MRPRLSDEEKKNRGTFKQSRSSGDELPSVVMVDAGAPDPVFPLSESGRELWDTITKTMVTYKTLAEVDIMAISMLCVEYDTYLECVGKSLIEIDGMSGNMKVSPYVTIKNGAIQNILKLSTQLGITPMMRMKIRPPESGKKVDPAAKFFNKK